MLPGLSAIRSRFQRPVNPVLVRLIRQDLRSAVFISVFLLMLLIGCASAVIAAVAAGANVSDGTGRGLFIAVIWVWGGVAIIIQGIQAHQAVARERQDDTWDLVELTGLPPARVLRGLIAAHVLQGAVVMSALAPFLVMAYLLRGVDLLTIAAGLVIVPLASFVAAVVSVCLATLANGKAARPALSAVSGLLCIGWWILVCALLSDERELTRFFERLAEGREDLIILAIILNCWLAVCALGLAIGGSQLKHRADDRSSTPRLVAVGIWLNLLGWLGLAMIFAVLLNLMRGRPLGDDLDDLVRVLPGILAAMAIVWTALVGWMATTEDTVLTPRQHRVCIEGGWLRRLAMMVLGPGAVRARRLFVAMLVVSTAFSLFCLLAPPTTSTWQADQSRQLLLVVWMMAMAASGWMALGDVLLRHTWLARLFTSARMRRVGMLGILAAWLFLPMLIGRLCDDSLILYSASPVSAMYQVIERKVDLPIYVISGIGLTGLVWLYARGRTRVEVIERVLAAADDRNPRA
jgi:hypothetical protein